jgi:hypothetical protein
MICRGSVGGYYPWNMKISYAGLTWMAVADGIRGIVERHGIVGFTSAASVRSSTRTRAASEEFCVVSWCVPSVAGAGVEGQVGKSVAEKSTLCEDHVRPLLILVCMACLVSASRMRSLIVIFVTIRHGLQLIWTR